MIEEDIKPDWKADKLGKELIKLRAYLDTVEEMDGPQMFSMLFAHMGTESVLIASRAKAPIATLGLLEKVMQFNLNRTVITSIAIINKRLRSV